MDYEIIEIDMANNIVIEKTLDAVPRGVFTRITLPRDVKHVFITYDLTTTYLCKLLTNYNGYIAVYSSDKFHYEILFFFKHCLKIV